MPRRTFLATLLTALAALGSAALAQPAPLGTTSTDQLVSVALDFAVQLIDDSPYRAARRGLDVSGDGDNNDGRAIMADARSPGSGSLDELYRDNVVGGPGAFVLVVDSFETFAYGIVNKIVREVAFVPVRTRLAGLDRPFIRIGGPGQVILPTIPSLRASLR